MGAEPRGPDASSHRICICNWHIRSIGNYLNTLFKLVSAANVVFEIHAMHTCGQPVHQQHVSLRVVTKWIRLRLEARRHAHCLPVCTCVSAVTFVSRLKLQTRRLEILSLLLGGLVFAVPRVALPVPRRGELHHMCRFSLAVCSCFDSFATPCAPS